jgi:hypothetical protein
MGRMKGREYQHRSVEVFDIFGLGQPHDPQPLTPCGSRQHLRVGSNVQPSGAVSASPSAQRTVFGVGPGVKAWSLISLPCVAGGSSWPRTPTNSWRDYSGLTFSAQGPFLPWASV